MSTVNITLSDDQLEGTKATVNQWLINIGEVVKKNQPIVELETDKVMMEIIAPESGVLTEILLNSGDTIDTNSILGMIDIKAVPQPKIETKSNKIQTIIKEPVISNTENTNLCTLNSTVLISPAVRRLCKQNNINLNHILGTGKNGRITTRDINHYLNTKPLQESLSSEHIPHTNMRKNIAKHMVKSLLHTAPHVTSVFNLDLSGIIAHRKVNKETFAKHNANLTFTTYFIAASALAIKSVPIINSQFHEETIEVFKNINIGIGTSLNDEGLIVPVLKNCQNKDLLTIAKELTDITNKARNNTLSPNDVKDGTFTISNHGVSGSLIATPIIINQPQSAILGIGKMEKRVIVKEIDNQDVMVIKPMCYVSLTIDHRVLDAHQTNQFLSEFVEILENWK